MRLLILFGLLLLVGCSEDFPFALPGKHYKGTAILHTIHTGAHKSDQRVPTLVSGDGVKFNFNFQEVCKPVDSAIQKLYGLSDGLNHMKNSARFGFVVKQDSSIDIFPFWHSDGNFHQQWMGTVHLYEWHYATVEIEKEFYEFQLDDKVIRFPRLRNHMGPFDYRLFPFYDDGNGHGAPGPVRIMIEELK